jgi:pimeloyl-ACP methyl ester carboxylesterase
MKTRFLQRARGRHVSNEAASSALRLSSIRTLIVTMCAATALSACGGGSGDATSAIFSSIPIDPRTTLAFGKCAAALNDPSVLCGTLSVPEDRADTQSRIIGLPFAIFPAKNTQKKTDPTVIYTGGPGPSSLLVFAEASSAQLENYPLRKDRDVIVLNQRGTDLTQPFSLDCNELAIDYEAGARFASNDEVIAAATRCRDRLIAQGAKLAAYDSRSSAADMEELRVLLGKQRGFNAWNVVGSSYGSRLALESMRRFPTGIRSVVLDGPLPTTINQFYDANMLDALTEVLVACSRQATCEKAFPDLKARFSEALERLEDLPITSGDQRISGHFILNALRSVLGTGQFEMIPLFMDLVAKRDFTAAESLIPISRFIELGPNPAGMWYSVTCRDNVRQVMSINEPLPPAKGAGWSDRLRRIAAYYESVPSSLVCPVWTSGQAIDTSATSAVRSSLPTLITVGAFDPATPVSSGRDLLRDLSQARLVVLPGKGHGLLESDACMLDLASRFINDPAQSLDVGCASPIAPDAFLTSLPSGGNELSVGSRRRFNDV